MKIPEFVSLQLLVVSKSFNLSLYVSTGKHEEMNQGYLVLLLVKERKKKEERKEETGMTKGRGLGRAWLLRGISWRRRPGA